MKNYLKVLTVFTLILGVLGFLLYLLTSKNILSPTLPFLYLFFYAISFLIYKILQRAEKKSTMQFINTYLLVTVIKLFLFVIVLVAFALLYPKDARSFILNFAVLYLCYLVFDIVMLFRKKV